MVVHHAYYPRLYNKARKVTHWRDEVNWLLCQVVAELLEPYNDYVCSVVNQTAGCQRQESDPH